MSFTILGLGTAVPAHTMSQDEAADLAREIICQNEQQKRLLTALYRKAGVDNRYTALPHRIAMNWKAEEPETESPMTGLSAVATGPTTGERMRFFEEHAAPLAVRAARKALEESAVDPKRITHLVTVSCTGFAAPGVDVELIGELGLRPTTQRIQVGFMGCHGAINGLRAAAAITAADPAARVLFCAVELCSLHYRFQWDPERIVANALFADGAAAIVGGGGDAPVSPADAWSVAATGSCLLPDSKDAMSWRIGDYGFEMTLSARVPDLIHTHLRPWLSAWLDEHGHTVESIGSWALHPGGPRILNACCEALGVTREQRAVSDEVLAEFGNMSSPTVLFILDRLRQKAAPRPCVALAFGPGLTAEAMLWR